MRAFFKKHKLTFDISASIVLALAAALYLYRFFGPEKKGMLLVVGIVFGLLSAFKAADAMEQYKTRKKKNMGNSL